MFLPKVLMRMAIRATIALPEAEESEHLGHLRQVLEEMTPTERALYRRRAARMWQVVQSVA